MRVDFYIISATDIGASYQLACRLIEKAYMKQHKVYVHTENQQQACKLDDLLWTFRDNSFIPHELLNENNRAAPPPVHIGCHQQAPDNSNDLMLNLTLAVPTFYQCFQRIIEIVPAIQSWQEALRQHYRFYREQGCQLFNHKIA